MKRMFKIFALVCVLFSVLTFYSSSRAISNPELVLNKEITVEIEDKVSELVKFVPLFSGRYKIESISDYDLKGNLYDSNKTKIFSDDDGGEFSNFAIIYEFKENQTYYIEVLSETKQKISCNLLLTVLKISQSHEHSFSLSETVEPTCAKDGEIIFSCVCGTLKIEPLPKTDHIYLKTVSEPTCTSRGFEKLICTKCSEVQITFFDVLGHELKNEFTVDKEATCTVQGSKSIHCSRCDERFEKTVINPTGHSFSSWITAIKPTCEKTGKNERSCNSCGKTETVLTNALGHKYSSKFTTDKAPTCTAQGSKSRRCERCSKKIDVTSLAPLGHGYSSKFTVDKKAGFTVSGSKSHHCSRCTSKTGTVTISKVKSAELSRISYAYDGNEKKPSVTVKDSQGKTLKYKTDYTVAFPKTSKAIGEYSVTVTLIGSYEGRKTLKYKILPGNVSGFSAKTDTNSAKLSWKAVKGAQKYRVYLYYKDKKEYKLLTETKKTSCKIEKLKSGTSYVFVVKALKTVGSKTFCSEKLTYKECSTYPAKTKLSAKANGRQAVLSWKKVGCTGYLIYASETKNGSYKQIKNVKGAGVTSYTKTNLAKGKTYYFKIRAYKTDGKKVLYSPYSGVVAVKIR